jgi:protein MpaA
MSVREGSPVATTREGRRIRWRRHDAREAFTSATPVRPLLVVGGVHGNEPSSVEATRALDAWLGANPPARAVLVVPALNLDGLARATKDNAAGVDLNRNFPARNWSPAHPGGYFPGERPLSEPEAAWLLRLIEEEDVSAVVAVHAPLACVNFDGPAREWAESVAAAAGWPVRASLGYPTPGSLGSWFGVDRARPIHTLELPSGPYRDFRAQADAALRSAVESAPQP